jgi:glyoxylase-like metal-dependent hydrolase (beta-lactamase superfamily II)
MFRMVIFLVIFWCAVAHAVDMDRKAIRVADGVHVLRRTNATGGEDRHGPVNVAFVIGPRGVAVIDTGSSYREGESIIAAVRAVTATPIRVAILTHPGAPAIFGAAAFQARGIPVLMHRDAAALLAGRCETCLLDLKATFGEAAMEETRVIVPDRVIDGDVVLDLLGRPLRLVAPPRSSAPGAIAVLDETTGTLIAGSIVSVDAVPDTRDGDPRGWRDALARLAVSRCRHLIPAYGPPARCSDIPRFARYFNDLDARVRALLRAEVSLAELGDRADLPEYAAWARYDALHRANASRAYLRLERDLFGIR